MDSSSRPKLVVENDSFLRLIQVVLDPAAPAERLAAFSHFCAHDLPDFAGWCERVRAGAQHLYPAAVRLVDDEAELLASLSGARAVVAESLAVGAREIAAAGNTVEIGRELALRAAALEMRIVYAQRHRLPGKIEERYRASYCAVDELLATSDCVSIHLPRSPATHGFIGRRELGIIKPGALLINVS